MKYMSVFLMLYREYANITKILFERQLLLDSNPFCQTNFHGKDSYDVTWSGKGTQSSILFDEEKSCLELLTAVRSARQYSLLLYDKSIIQAEYVIENENIVKGRLLFIKLQNKIWSRDEMEEYADDPDMLDEYLDEEIGLPTMIRIDYDPKNHVDCEHPQSHFVFNNLKDCRIPMKSVISLGQFLDFIFKQVYGMSIPQLQEISFDSTITEQEMKLMHINW